MSWCLRFCSECQAHAFTFSKSDFQGSGATMQTLRLSQLKGAGIYVQQPYCF